MKTCREIESNVKTSKGPKGRRNRCNTCSDSIVAAMAAGEALSAGSLHFSAKGYVMVLRRKSRSVQVSMSEIHRSSMFSQKVVAYMLLTDLTGIRYSSWNQCGRVCSSEVLPIVRVSKKVQKINLCFSTY